MANAMNVLGERSNKTLVIRIVARIRVCVVSYVGITRVPNYKESTDFPQCLPQRLGIWDGNSLAAGSKPLYIFASEVGV